jgi:gluconolactonase
MRRMANDWKPVTRYPDPAVEVLDKRFDRLRVRNACVERLFTGCRWAEGPVWLGDARSFVWSDIPNDRMLRWDEETLAVGVFRKPSNYANGNTRDRQGRIVTCEHGGRRVTRTEHDGTITVLAEGYKGKRLNSPNDVVVKSDGAVWFTDPSFGILSHYEGHAATPELPTNVYRVDPATREIVPVIESISMPNGLAFSADERLLFVVESGSTPRRIHVFDVVDHGRACANGRVFIDCGAGVPDGFRLDLEGNLWCGWGGGEGHDGVRVFSPTAEPIGHIHLPERCANVCFGGVKRNRLFMAASQSLYTLYVNAQGLPYF